MKKIQKREDKKEKKRKISSQVDNSQVTISKEKNLKKIRA